MKINREAMAVACVNLFELPVTVCVCRKKKKVAGRYITTLLENNQPDGGGRRQMIPAHAP
jgi:hypothetical protein